MFTRVRSGDRRGDLAAISWRSDSIIRPESRRSRRLRIDRGTLNDGSSRELVDDRGPAVACAQRQAPS